MNFKIFTLGCKVNTYESVVIKEKLLKDGFKEAKKADVVIINTCSVTNVADNKSFKMIRKVKKENPKAILVVCGCSSQNNKEKYAELGIDILLGNKEKSLINEKIKDFIKTKKSYQNICKMQNSMFEDMQIDKFNNVRAYIKIQDGCNNYCSYCVIPYLRGNLRCKNFDLIIKEAHTLVSNGHKEIVLTGIHTGSYNDSGYDLCDLINELSKIPKLERIRLSSIEITEINNDKFYDLLINNQKLCNSMHIPIQAGSDEVLKRMNRKYNVKYFKDVITKIRNIRPEMYISTDCLVGHPYETDELFQETLNTCKKIGFSKIHVFPYSKREGTAAAGMPCQVREEIKHQRARKLIEISNELEKEYQNKFIGNERLVLIEEKNNGMVKGHTDNMLKLCFKGNYSINEIVNVKIEENFYE